FNEQLKNGINQNQNEIDYEMKEIHYYDLTDNLVGEYEKDFFRNEDALGKLKIMYAMLTQNTQFDYLEIYNNPIVLIGDGLEDKMLYRYEDGEGADYRGIVENQVYNEVKCYWISCNVQNTFQIEFEQGNIWKEDEKNNNCIPIVLGSDYAGKYHVGDFIEGVSPINENVQFQVYGILKSGEYLIHRNRMVNLDRYVLIPLQDARSVPSDKEDERSQILLYLFKINGTLSSILQANDLQNMVQDICDTSGVFPSSTLTGASNAQSYILHDSMTNILGSFEQMLLILNLFSTGATILYILLKINKNREYYGILMLNGFSVKQVNMILLGTIILTLFFAEGLSVLLGIAITYILGGMFDLPVIRLIISNIEILSIVGLVGFLKIRNIDLSACIGGNE
ncbi:MAG TPA: hypothetical protein VJY54_11900, partial [Lachnospiraceae bacterium]|nr:hypothetical protein [Lachnospiraceae bacterium]